MPNKFAKETLVFQQQAKTIAAAERASRLPEDVSGDQLQELRAWGIGYGEQRGVKAAAKRVTGAYADELNALSASAEQAEAVRAEAEAEVARSLDAIRSDRQRIVLADKLAGAQSSPATLGSGARAVRRAGVVAKPAPKAVSRKKRGAKRARKGVNEILKAGAKALSQGFRFARSAEKEDVVARFKAAKESMAVISQMAKGKEESTMEEWIASLIEEYAQPSQGRKKRVRMSKSSIYNWVKADQVRVRTIATLER